MKSSKNSIRCGIYKITNIINGKSYIGQSINISNRWKQHTQSLDKIKNVDEENPLRRAFCKYGLRQQVSRPGVYGKIEINCFDFDDEICFCNEVHKGFVFNERFCDYLSCNPEFIIENFLPLRKEYPDVHEAIFVINEGVLKFAKAYPDILCTVLQSS